MKNCTIVLLFIVFSLGLCQKLINLNNFHGNDYINKLSVDAPYSMYISASSDSANLLSNIFVYNQGDKISLNELKNYKISSTSGEYKLYIIEQSAYVKTALTTDQMKTLTGVMYISNPNQAKDGNFHVIDIDKSQTFTFQDLGDISLTYLFLSTHMDTTTPSSSIISQWKQSSDARNFIYAGFPTRSIETKNTQIFSNPMYTTTNFDGYFANVETFSLTTQAFYLRSYRGFSFKIEPGYWSVDGSTTSSYNTTGFYMKPLNRDDGPITIYTKKDTLVSGYTGANIIGTLPTSAQVTVAEYGGPHDDKISIHPNDIIVPWSTPNIGDRIELSSTIGSPGKYYVQYFVLEGQLTSATTVLPGNQTTTKGGSSVSTVTTPTGYHVETTTTGSGTIKILISMIVSFMVFLGFY